MLRLLIPALFMGGLCCCVPGEHHASTHGLVRQAEALAGARAAATLESTYGGLYHCSEAQCRVERIAARLAACEHAGDAEQYHIKLLATDALNAFALPTNRIYLTSGLYHRIGQDDGLIAAAIAHEMAHIKNRDSFKPECRTSCESLDRERAADQLATQYLEGAGFDPQSLTRLLTLIADVQPEGWAETRVRYLCAAR